MPKCDFCQQLHEWKELCKCKVALNHLLWAGHVEQYDHLNSGNWSFCLKRLDPENTA